jgi:L,D-peptidoglycan transpeptidase YkuD (ErfK/YbiS/YcfS/YnhG family)
VTRLGLTLLVLFAAWPAVAAPVRSDVRQLIVVQSDTWTATKGRMQRYERAAYNQPWRPVGPPWEVVLGRAGMGWGVGEDDLRERNINEVRKREGDERAPAGVFAFDGGWAEGGVLAGARIPLRKAGAELLCVDDPGSDDYNQVVEAAQAKPHKTAEKLQSSDAQYSLGIVVAHNRTPVRKGLGSCVFLHVWAAPGLATAGCTAMSKVSMVTLLRWLDPAKKPRLVQLPGEVYRNKRVPWGLP